MPAFHRRFVGAKTLPKSLTDFDVEQSFPLSSDDIDAIRRKFNTGNRLAATLQLVILRATGRPLVQLSGLPRALLSSLSASLGLDAPSLATLKSLYQRSRTLYDHQQWAREASALTQKPGRRWASPRHNAFDIRVNPEAETADAPSERS